MGDKTQDIFRQENLFTVKRLKKVKLKSILRGDDEPSSELSSQVHKQCVNFLSFFKLRKGNIFAFIEAGAITTFRRDYLK